jgi:hypothetical protein
MLWTFAYSQIGGPMQGQTKEHWIELCEQAAVEQDANKLLQLITEINRMLDQKEDRLKRVPLKLKQEPGRSS